MIWTILSIKVSAIHFSDSWWMFSFSRSILGGDLKTLLDRNWLESFSLSFAEWLFSSFRSLVDNNPNTPRSKVSAIRYSVSEWTFSFSKSIVDNDPNILLDRGAWNPLLFFLQMNLCLFSRSIVEKDQNTVVDRKWLELTSLSVYGISFFLDLSSTMIRTVSRIQS